MTTAFATMFFACFAIGATTAVLRCFMRSSTTRLILFVCTVYYPASALASYLARADRGLYYLGLELFGSISCVCGIVLIAFVINKISGRWQLSGRRA